MVDLALCPSAMQPRCPSLHGGTAQASGMISEGPGGTASWCLDHLYWQELSKVIDLSQD